MQERVGKNMVNMSQNFDTKEEIILPMDHSKGLTRLKDQKLNKSDHHGQTKAYEGKHDVLTAQDDLDVLKLSRMDEVADHSKDIINIESSPQKVTR
jgi:hypothetical protein